jgi:transcriptional regulator with XRE-family HTH domain
MGRGKRWTVKRLPEKLLQIREALGLSQTGLMRELGLDQTLYQSNISSYESGHREPPLPVILAYARLARVSTDDLIDDRVELRLKNLK